MSSIQTESPFSSHLVRAAYCLAIIYDSSDRGHWSCMVNQAAFDPTKMCLCLRGTNDVSSVPREIAIQSSPLRCQKS